MSWFHALTGFDEMSWRETRARFEVDGATLRSRVNGRTWAIGTLETPSLTELRARAESLTETCAGRRRVTSVVADVARLPGLRCCGTDRGATARW